MSSFLKKIYQRKESLFVGLYGCLFLGLQFFSLSFFHFSKDVFYQVLQKQTPLKNYELVKRIPMVLDDAKSGFFEGEFGFDRAGMKY